MGAEVLDGGGGVTSRSRGLFKSLLHVCGHSSDSDAKTWRQHRLCVVASVACASLFIGIGSLRAADTSEGERPAARASLDAQDVVFLGPNRPVWMRMKITVGIERAAGCRFGSFGVTIIAACFADLDADKNGVLSGDEAAKAMPMRYAVGRSDDAASRREAARTGRKRRAIRSAAMTSPPVYEQHAAAAISVRPGAGSGPDQPGAVCPVGRRRRHLPRKRRIGRLRCLAAAELITTATRQSPANELVDDRDARARNEQTAIVSDEAARLRHVGPLHSALSRFSMPRQPRP